MQSRVARVIPIGLKFARGICRTHFDIPMSNLGLVGAHHVIDDIDYWIVPKAGDLQLSWHAEKRKRHISCALLEIYINEKSYSRIFWESEKGWLYSMMGATNERRVCSRGKHFLESLNTAVGTNLTIGIEQPVEEAMAVRIIEFHGYVVLTEWSKA